MEKRFIFGSLDKWNGELVNGVYSNRGTNQEKYFNSIVFITETGDNKKGTMIYTHGAYFEMSNQSDVISIIEKHVKAGEKINFTGTPETGLTINVDYVTSVKGTCTREENGYYEYKDEVNGYQLVEARAVAGALTEPFKLSLTVDKESKKGQFTQHFKTLNGDDVTFASAIIEAGDGLTIEQTTEGLKLSADLSNLKEGLDYTGYDENPVLVDNDNRKIGHKTATASSETGKVRTISAEENHIDLRYYEFDSYGHISKRTISPVKLPDTAFTDTKLTSATINAGEIAAVEGTVAVVSNATTSLTGTNGESISGNFTAVNVPTKDYVDNLVANKNVTAEGDDYVTATAEGNKVTVAVTQEIKDAVSYADSALQTLSGTSNDYVQASFAGKAGENGAKTDVLTVELTSKTITSLGKADTAVQTVVTGETYGTIKVDGEEVAVAGLEDLAYAEVDDKILSLNDGKLSTTLTFTKEDVDGAEYLIIKGIEGQEIGKVATSEFVKDGMLSNVSFSEETNDLTFTFNTDAGKEAVVVPLDSLVNIYTGKNGVKVEGYEISGVVDPKSEDFLTVGTDGFKLSGVQEAINEAVANKNVSASGETGDNALVTASATNNAVTVGSTEKLQNAVAAAETALQGIEKGTDGDFVTTTIGAKDENNKQTVAVSVTTAAVAGSETTDGLATASDVKTYVDAAKAAATTKVVESTDTESAKYLDITSATEADNSTTYTVKVSGIDTAISTAIQDLDAEVTSTDGNKVQVKVTEVDGVITAVNVTETDIASAEALAELAANVEENAEVAAAGLADLNSKIEEINETIENLDFGVTSVQATTSSAHVTVAPTTATDGAVTVSVDVASVDATDKATFVAKGLATDAYVDEEITGAITALDATATGAATTNADENKINVATGVTITQTDGKLDAAVTVAETSVYTTEYIDSKFTAVETAGEVKLESTAGNYVFTEEKAGYVTAEHMAAIMNEAWAWGTL